MARKTWNIRSFPEIYDRLKMVSVRDGRSISQICERFIIEMLAKEEPISIMCGKRPDSPEFMRDEEETEPNRTEPVRTGLIMTEERKEEKAPLCSPSLSPTPPITPPIIPQKEEKRELLRTLGFEKFWEKYPRKKSKGQAEKVWKKINPTQELIAQIMASLELAKRNWNDKDFILYPATWLNAKGWLDEHEVKLEPPKTPSTVVWTPPPEITDEERAKGLRIAKEGRVKLFGSDPPQDKPLTAAEIVNQKAEVEKMFGSLAGKLAMNQN